MSGNRTAEMEIRELYRQTADGWDAARREIERLNERVAVLQGALANMRAPLRALLATAESKNLTGDLDCTPVP